MTEDQNRTISLIDAANRLVKIGDFRAAQQRSEEALSFDPEHREALYLLAVSLRYQQQTGGALDALDRLKRARPNYGRAYQEEGHIHRLMGERDLAISAYEEAVRRNSSLKASWKMLTKLYGDSGQQDALENAKKHFEYLTALPLELRSVISFTHEEKLDKAEALCRKFLQKTPHHVEAMRLLAVIGIERQVYDEAEFLLESCLELEPTNTRAHLDYVSVLHKRQRFARAHAEAKILTEVFPNNMAYKVLFANECCAVGDYKTALTIYELALQAMPENAGLYLAQGHALKTVGRYGDAIVAYQAALAVDATFGEAYWSLANLKTYDFSASEREEMDKLLEGPALPKSVRTFLYFARGKAYEDRDEFDAAFEHYDHGNNLKHALTRHNPDRMTATLAAQKNICTGSFFKNLPQGGCLEESPIFIVGLPRAGSTLVEQILASHFDVEGTMELPDIPAIAHGLSGSRRRSTQEDYPDVLAALTPEKRTALGKSYIRNTMVHRKGQRFFTDKMPNNFRHIGLIHMILPNAKIIDIRRGALDCCLSNFKQLFAEGQEFSYSLSDLAQYYRDYTDLMAHYDAALPGKILHVQYETLVEDLENQVGRILAHCGLPFDANCLSFHRNDRAVRTPSSEQVRKPISSDSVGYWRNFSSHLSPLQPYVAATWFG
ncbi:MAG: hypothetical protein COB37_06200 [Kordiimonadales bacterium]|nr:MAG: hypothetical protein COB37_06200 [Kordiimonadales bacterium]